MPPFARLRDVVPSAYLRVFQPLDGFERQEQLHWERYLVEGARSMSLRPRYADRVTTGRLGIMAPSDGEHAEPRSGLVVRVPSPEGRGTSALDQVSLPVGLLLSLEPVERLEDAEVGAGNHVAESSERRHHLCSRRSRRWS